MADIEMTDTERTPTAITRKRKADDSPAKPSEETQEASGGGTTRKKRKDKKPKEGEIAKGKDKAEKAPVPIRLPTNRDLEVGTPSGTTSGNVSGAQSRQATPTTPEKSPAPKDLTDDEEDEVARKLKKMQMEKEYEEKSSSDESDLEAKLASFRGELENSGDFEKIKAYGGGGLRGVLTLADPDYPILFFNNKAPLKAMERAGKKDEQMVKAMTDLAKMSKTGVLMSAGKMAQAKYEPKAMFEHTVKLLINKNVNVVKISDAPDEIWYYACLSSKRDRDILTNASFVYNFSNATAITFRPFQIPPFPTRAFEARFRTEDQFNEICRRVKSERGKISGQKVVLQRVVPEEFIDYTTYHTFYVTAPPEWGVPTHYLDETTAEIRAVIIKLAMDCVVCKGEDHRFDDCHYHEVVREMNRKARLQGAMKKMVEIEEEKRALKKARG